MKQKKIFIIIGVLFLGLLGFWLFHKTSTASNAITGSVTTVIDKPNLAEDGYYGFDVQSSSGRKYTINATGHLNIPAFSGASGKTCVNVPKVKTGDKVEFNLPKSGDRAGTFGTCYKKGLTGYYFKLN